MMGYCFVILTRVLSLAVHPARIAYAFLYAMVVVQKIIYTQSTMRVNSIIVIH